MPLMRRARQANLDVSGIRTKDLVLNHIVKGWVDVEDIQNEQILNTEFEKSTIRMNVFPKLQMYNQRESEEDVYPYLYTANCVPIVKPNKIASNGIVHMVDQVLMPVTKTVMELISERDDMTVFRTVLEKTNLGKYLAGTHDENGVVWPDNAQRQVSIFAPSDSAFEKLDPQLRRKFKEGSACAASKYSSIYIIIII